VYDDDDDDDDDVFRVDSEASRGWRATVGARAHSGRVHRAVCISAAAPPQQQQQTSRDGPVARCQSGRQVRGGRLRHGK